MTVRGGLLVLAMLGAVSAAGGEDWHKDYHELRTLRDQNKWQQALVKGREMYGTFGMDPNKIREIAELMGDACRRGKEWDQAVRVYAEYAAKVPGDEKAMQWSLKAQADTERDGQRNEKALAAYQKILDTYPKAGPLCADARLQRGYIHKDRTRDYEAAIAELVQVEQTDNQDRARLSSALMGMADCHLVQKRPAEALALYKRVLTDFVKDQPHWTLRGAKGNSIRAINEGQLWADGVPFLAQLEAQETDWKFKSELGLHRSNALRASGQREAALSAYAQCQAAYPNEADYLYECQKQIVALWVEQQKFTESLAHAKLLFALANDEKRIVEASTIVAGCLKAIDGNLERANAFLRFQKWGPLGVDGKPGTDDMADPLMKVTYPSEPERTKLLLDGLAKTGDSDGGARQRAFLNLLLGRPKEALAEFRAQFALCDDANLQRAAQEWVLVGVKTVQGHTTGLKPFYDWLNYGAAGPDGKGGAADPFKGLE